MALVREVILPLPYFGSIGHYAHLVHSDVWIDLHEHYVKQTCRNRMEIAGPQGLMKLSVPIRKRSGRKQLMAEVKVSYDEDWQKDHWRSLQTAYNASPFFLYYRDALEDFFLESHDTLSELNIASHKVVSSFLKLDCPLRFTERYIESTFGQDFRNDPSLGNLPMPPYIQVFSDRHPFLTNLSILDLIFCLGPDSAAYLQALQT
jgi:hypothetical protein